MKLPKDSLCQSVFGYPEGLPSFATALGDNLTNGNALWNVFDVTGNVSNVR